MTPDRDEVRDPLDPPEPFTLPTVHCPACGHGIDPHGPTEPCGVGDAEGLPCGCVWTPNDIAGLLVMADGREVPVRGIRLILLDDEGNPVPPPP